ncbi:hypothetical protein ACHWQZ_G004730 [Mnemiopsis leidyi]
MGSRRPKSNYGTLGPIPVSERYFNERRYTNKGDRNSLKINDVNFRGVSLDHFEPQEPFILGKGGHSMVQCYKHIKSDTIMALKRRRFGQLNELDKKTKVTRDIEHLRKLRGHSNIITLYGYFEMCGEAFICMEKMATCFAKILQNCVKKDILIPTKVLATLCYSISSALVFLKEKKVIHRDVKPANMLLGTEGQIKLSDFDGSGYLYNSYCFSDPTITHCYAAPERIDCDDKKNEAKFDCTADVWSLGVSTLELATKKHPFASKDMKAQFDLMKMVLSQEPPKLPSTFPGYDQNLADFIAQCLKKNPEERMYPKVKNGRFYIMKHKFISMKEILSEKRVADWYNNQIKN